MKRSLTAIVIILGSVTFTKKVVYKVLVKAWSKGNPNKMLVAMEFCCTHFMENNMEFHK